MNHKTFGNMKHPNPLVAHFYKILEFLFIGYKVRSGDLKVKGGGECPIVTLLHESV